MDQQRPNLRTESDGQQSRIFLHCSSCGERLMRIGRNRALSLDCGYFCVECQIDIGLEAAQQAAAKQEALPPPDPEEAPAG